MQNSNIKTSPIIPVENKGGGNIMKSDSSGFYIMLSEAEELQNTRLLSQIQHTLNLCGQVYKLQKLGTRKVLTSWVDQYRVMIYSKPQFRKSYVKVSLLNHQTFETLEFSFIVQNSTELIQKAISKRIPLFKKFCDGRCHVLCADCPELKGGKND